MARAAAGKKIPADAEQSLSAETTSADPLDDILAELTSSPADAGDDLDALLGELAAPAPQEADPLDDILAEVAPAPVEADDDLDALLGELAAPAAQETDPLHDILAEVAPAPVEADDDLDALLGELAAPAQEADPLDDILAEVAPAPVETEDDLDALLGELAAPAPQGPDPLDDILMDVAPPPAEGSSNLDALFDEIVVPAEVEALSFDSVLDEVTPAALKGEPDEVSPQVEAPDSKAVAGKSASSHSVEADELASGSADSALNEVQFAPDQPGGRSSRLRKTGLVLASTAVLSATNGLSYYLGMQAGSAHSSHPAVVAPSPVEQLAPPKPQGLDRYVGLTSQARIGGKTIFQTEEIQSAIQKLDGGEELQRNIEKLSRNYVSVEPIGREGPLIRIYSCSKLSCAQDNVKIYYNTFAKRAAVCVTEPYLYGRGVSYAYTKSGFREIASCDGNPFPKGV